MLDIIIAKDQNNIVGRNGTIPWSCKEDQQMFSRITKSYKAMIMGRKTFESLPCMLPNRKHLVLSTNKDYAKPLTNDKFKVITNRILDRLIESEHEYVLIGGVDVIAQVAHRCRLIYLSTIQTKLRPRKNDIIIENNFKDYATKQCTHKGNGFKMEVWSVDSYGL
jgi:dihydrofolate reductase